MANQGRTVRRHYFIDKDFQLRFILKFCMVVVGIAVLMMAMVYFFAGKATAVSIVNSRVVVRSTADFLLPLIVQTLIIGAVCVGIATSVVSLMTSHKIAGPLFRFRAIMQALARGDFSGHVRLRAGDQLKVFADDCNTMIAANRSRLQAIADTAAQLQKKVAGLSEDDVSEAKLAVLAQVRALSGELQKSVNSFQL